MFLCAERHSDEYCFFVSVKIHELHDMKQMYAIIPLEDERSLDRISWTDDGQLLAVSTSRGAVHIYLTKLPVLGASHLTKIAYLTSLLEVTLQDNVQQVSNSSSNFFYFPSILHIIP
jgi:WD repeat-containing protein 19